MQNKKNPFLSLTDDLRFLIVCCQNNPSKEDTSFLLSHLLSRSSTVLESRTLNPLIVLANQHGILPLIYKTIKKQTLQDPTFNIQHWQTTYLQVAQRNMLMSAELIRILKLLEENDIQALALKGPTLAQMAYGDITLRQYGDLDILIKPKDFKQVHEILTDKMYDTLYNYDCAIEKVLELIPDHMFINTNHQIPIEIHNKLFASNFPVQVMDDIFWEHPTNVTINNQAIPTIQKEYLLFYLCLHGGKHLFSRISWIVDIAKLIDDTTNDFDWKVFEQILDKHSLNTIVSVGLHLSKILLQSKMPDDILQKINNNTRALNIAHSIINNISENPSNTERFTFTHLQMLDSWYEKIQYSIYLFKPSVQDYQIFNTQYKSEVLYYILRPLNILYRTILKIFNKKS